jgi:ABC-2 type transport system ATP-binding protein
MLHWEHRGGQSLNQCGRGILMELQIDSVSMYFGGKKALSNVSLTLTPGVWSLLGANGAGKTTLMRIIAGILPPSTGRVAYNGVGIGELGGQYRAVFGYLPQEFGFDPAFTAEEYLCYLAALKGVPEKLARQRMAALFEELSLTEVRQKRIKKLSGGMKRRVGIAGALLGDPEVLVLDEPTSGLDPGERVRLRNLLARFAEGRIVLISTHIVPDVEFIASRHALIKKGKLLAVGTTEELVRQAEGLVWRCRIPAGAVPDYERQYQIAGLQHEGDGTVSLRCLGERPSEGAEPVPPTLEDLCLLLFPKEGGRDL